LKRQIEDLKLQLKDHDEILDHLMALPERDSLEFLRQLRTASNTTHMLSAIRGGANSTYRLSDHITTRSILPTTQSGIEFELSVRHPIAYPTLYPRDVTINLGSFLESMISSTPTSADRFRNDPWQKQIQVRNQRPSSLPPLDAFRAHPISALLTRREHNSSTPARMVMVAGPSQVSSYCDDRLHQLSLEEWTEIPINNEFAASAISVYLEKEYRLLSLFDADLFLNGLLSGDQEFCSPILLAAVLAHGCVSSTVYYMCQHD
jgi:hypothetical protein